VNTTLLHQLANNWWVLLVHGLVGVLFGLLALAWPGITLVSLILLFGIYLGAVGILEVVAAIRGGTLAPRWWLAIAGLVALVASAVTFLAPGITALSLIYIIGVWALAHSLFEIIGAVRVRKLINNEWALILSGILSALFGIVVLFRPGAGALGLVWVIGLYAVAVGVLFIGLAFRLKKHQAISQPRLENSWAEAVALNSLRGDQKPDFVAFSPSRSERRQGTDKSTPNMNTDK
jgi:uncharacterized membrane protein HdeD (DUF308 family)